EEAPRTRAARAAGAERDAEPGEDDRREGQGEAAVVLRAEVVRVAAAGRLRRQPALVRRGDRLAQLGEGHLARARAAAAFEDRRGVDRVVEALEDDALVLVGLAGLEVHVAV